MSNTEKGIAIVCFSTLIFATQDALTKYLGVRMAIESIVGLRYTAFFLVALIFAHFNGGVRANLKSAQRGLQILRGLLLAAEIWIFAIALKYVGVGYMHGIFEAYPLIVAALSPWLLGEHVGWRRWLAILCGFVGSLIIISVDFKARAGVVALPLLCALMFAVYTVFTRKVARTDSVATSMLYTGMMGAIIFVPMLPFTLEPMDQATAIGMSVLALMGSFSHILLIIAYSLAPAALLQPFNYFVLVWAFVWGVMFFGEEISTTTILGAVLVVASGIFVWWRERTEAAQSAILMTQKNDG